jgi:hypothetical protein
LSDTILPLVSGGDNSAIYIGDNIDAIPTPTPARQRKAMKEFLPSARAIAIEEMKNMSAANKSPGLRPYRSEMLPAIRQPKMHPIASDAVAKPSQYSSSPKLSFKKGNAPEITAKSKPKRYPPSADINDMTVK